MASGGRTNLPLVLDEIFAGYYHNKTTMERQDITALLIDVAKLSAELAQTGAADIRVLNTHIVNLDWENMYFDTEKLLEVLWGIKQSNIFDYKPE